MLLIFLYYNYFTSLGRRVHKSQNIKDILFLLLGDVVLRGMRVLCHPLI